MRTVFFGTPELATPTLRAMAADAVLRPVAVFTQPPARRSRRGASEPSAVATVARELGLECHEVASVNEGAALERLRELKPEVIVVVSFGQILKRSVLKLAPHGCLNMHPSRLPLFRGAAPVQRAVMAGVRESAISIMRLVRKLDAGPVLAQQAWTLGDEKTAEELLVEAGARGAALMIEILRRLAAGENPPGLSQDDSLATYAPPLTKEDGLLDFSRDAQSLNDRIRGVQPWPRASASLFAGDSPPRRVIVHRARVVEGKGVSGEVLRVDEAGILIGCGRDCLLLTQCQLEGKARQDAAALARGLRLKPGACFGAAQPD